jgi:hypothetical protein
MATNKGAARHPAALTRAEAVAVQDLRTLPTKQAKACLSVIARLADEERRARQREAKGVRGAG